MKTTVNVFLRRLATTEDKKTVNRDSIRFFTIDPSEEFNPDEIVLIQVEDIKGDKYRDLTDDRHYDSIIDEVAAILAHHNLRESLLPRLMKGSQGYFPLRDFDKDGNVTKEYSGTALWFATPEAGLTKRKGINLDGVSSGKKISLAA